MYEKVSIIPLKENLRKLADHMSELRFIDSDLVNDIGKYLANGLKDNYTPRDFGAALVILINSLEEETQKRTKRDIASSLLGLHPANYEALVDSIPEITGSICPKQPEYKSFVEGVKDFYEEALRREAESLQ